MIAPPRPIAPLVLVALLLLFAHPSRADHLDANAEAVVVNTGAQGLRLRAGPGTDQSVRATLPENVVVFVVEGPLLTGGEEWYRITYNGQSGWAAARFLAPPQTPTAPVGRALAPPVPVSIAPAGLGSAGNAATTPTPRPGSPSLVAALAPVATSTPIPAAARKPANPTAVRLAQTTLALVGAPYVWGGRSAAGFDCSGLVFYVFGQFGIALPPTTFEQWTVGRPVSQDELLPGDVVFFENTYAPGISHNGVYVGDGAFVHAATEGVGVIQSRLREDYWAKRYAGARRQID